MSTPLLSTHQLTSQLDTYNFLLSAYCLDGEFSPTTPLLPLSPSSRTPLLTPLSLCTSLSHSSSHWTLLSLSLHVSLPLREREEKGKNGIRPIIHLRCPSWMNKKAYSELVAKMKEVEAERTREGGMEDGEGEGGVAVMWVVDFLRDNSLSYSQSNKPAATNQVTKEEGKVVRAWFNFPSLSTKEKRQDLVDYAPTYQITGFVVAGKPGIMCLEGTSHRLSSYMSDIKNISWADIPANNKKVSERYREEEGVERVFQDMQEVTDLVFQAGMRGTRGNRGDMEELRGYLEQFGLGDRLEKVLGANWE